MAPRLISVPWWLGVAVPLAGVMRTALARGEHWIRRVDTDIRWLAANLLTPLERRFETGISALAERLAALEEGRAHSRHAAGKMS